MFGKKKVIHKFQEKIDALKKELEKKQEIIDTFTNVSEASCCVDFQKMADRDCVPYSVERAEPGKTLIGYISNAEKKEFGELHFICNLKRHEQFVQEFKEWASKSKGI